MTSELRTRTISAIALGSAVLFITWWSATAFAVMCILGAGILFREWRGLTKHRGWWWVPIGMVYIGGAVVSLVAMRNFHIYLLAYLFAIVWGGDIAAYLIGKKWGKHKIAPTISPGKSWEGLLASIVASIGITLSLIAIVEPLKPHAILLYAITATLLSGIGFLGDLFESALKRKAGVKDSGTLIPGHGGLFDRVDSLIACAIAMPILLLATLALGCFVFHDCLD